MLLEIVFKGRSHGPMSVAEAAAFVHAERIPLSAAVRQMSDGRLHPLRRFPVLARAARAAAEGKPAPAVPARSTFLQDGADYTPNHLNVGERFLALFWAGGLIGFSLWGLSHGAIPIVGGSRRGGSAVLIGGPAMWLMLAANLLLALAALIAFVDHYDRRNNERNYRRAMAVVGGAGLVLMVVAIVAGIGSSRVT